METKSENSIPFFKTVETSCYQVLTNYLKDNQLEFLSKPSSEISRKYIRQYIIKYGLNINNTLIYRDTHKIQTGDRIIISDIGVDFQCEVISEETLDVTSIDNHLIISKEVILAVTENIDERIRKFIISGLNCEKVEDIVSLDIKEAFCHVILLFQKIGFEIVKESSYSYYLTDFIKSKLQASNLSREYLLGKRQLSFAGEMIELLIQIKNNKEQDLKKLNEDLLCGQYDASVFKYLQNYRKIISSEAFQYLINPLINNTVSSPIAIENLIKCIRQSNDLEGIEVKYHHYESSKILFDTYFDLLKGCDDYNNQFFYPPAEYLFKVLKVNCDTDIEKAAQIVIHSTDRKYNFSTKERIQQDIFLVVENTGEGLAKNVIISSESSNFGFDNIVVGMLKPGEKREVSATSMIGNASQFTPTLKVSFNWLEVSGELRLSESDVEFQLQKEEIPWEDLKKRNPYSNSIIDNVDNLFGREEILEELESNILSDNIESYKLWGQKRVGKSSIVKTLKSIIDTHEKIMIVYRSLGGLKNANAVVTLNTLGESLCGEVYEEIDKKIKDANLRERLRGVSIPIFDGSLYPLETYIKQLRKIDNTLKFIFILDEFDRINEEFFLPGNLGETLSLSIGKGLNENRYIGFIVVGSENMHLLDRQGINYNSYQEKEVDTFDKQREYKSFVKIVKGPISPYINYSDEAIEKIFYASNGNPYFANLICGNIFKNAYKFQDNEVDVHSVDQAISLIINSSQKSHFEHYWSDGITEESNIKKERKADIRRRILVSFSMSSNQDKNDYPDRGEIARGFKNPIETEYKIEKYEVDNTITEFINRKIFIVGVHNEIRILPHLFESWLCGKGKSLMIEGVSDLEALQREIDLEKELALKQDELQRISENYYFRGDFIKLNELREYFNQFGDAAEQRRVFNLIDSVYFISKDSILEFYRKEKRNIFSKTEILLKEKAKTFYREGIELYTFSKYHKENLLAIESFKVLNHIKPAKLIKVIREHSQVWKKNMAEEIIVLEPIIESYTDIHDELSLLLTDELKSSSVSIRIITFVITTKAKVDLITATSSFSNLKLISFQEVEETKIKPFTKGTEIFENSDESNQAYYQVRKIFPQISKECLLILFEDFCPSKSCPVLWAKTPQFNPIFLNAHGNLELEHEATAGEKRRDELYFEGKKFSQAINKFMIEYIKEKAEIDGEIDWFILKYIPRKTLDNVNRKWLDENQRDPKESYFDFLDYYEIVLHNKDPKLQKIFMIGEKDAYSWMKKCNSLRRDPAHPEKPCPSVEDIEYFKSITAKILPRLSSYI